MAALALPRVPVTRYMLPTRMCMNVHLFHSEIGAMLVFLAAITSLRKLSAALRPTLSRKSR